MRKRAVPTLPLFSPGAPMTQAVPLPSRATLRIVLVTFLMTVAVAGGVLL